MNEDVIVLRIAEIIREIATRQGNVPFLTGDLRKSIVVHHTGKGQATVGSNLPYARPVHDGRPAITIRPKNRKALAFTIGGKKIVRKVVHQPPRKARPFLTNAVKTMKTQEWDKVEMMIGKEIADELSKILRAKKV